MEKISAFGRDTYERKSEGCRTPLRYILHRSMGYHFHCQPNASGLLYADPDDVHAIYRGVRRPVVHVSQMVFPLER